MADGVPNAGLQGRKRKTAGFHHVRSRGDRCRSGHLPANAADLPIAGACLPAADHAERILEGHPRH